MKSKYFIIKPRIYVWTRLNHSIILKLNRPRCSIKNTIDSDLFVLLSFGMLFPRNIPRASYCSLPFKLLWASFVFSTPAEVGDTRGNFWCSYSPLSTLPLYLSPASRSRHRYTRHFLMRKVVLAPVCQSGGRCVREISHPHHWLLFAEMRITQRCAYKSCRAPHG